MSPGKLQTGKEIVPLSLAWTTTFTGLIMISCDLSVRELQGI